jgi:hypothetical protein
MAYSELMKKEMAESTPATINAQSWRRLVPMAPSSAVFAAPVVASVGCLIAKFPDSVAVAALDTCTFIQELGFSKFDRLFVGQI